MTSFPLFLVRRIGFVMFLLLNGHAVAQDGGNEVNWLVPAQPPAPRLPREPLLLGGSMPAGELEERLIAAARQGEIKSVKDLLAAGARANAQALDGTRALHEAVAGGHWELARILLKQGADPNATDAQGRTPLDAAVAYRRGKLVSLLVQHGSDLERRNKLGNTPLATALLLARDDEANLLLNAGARIDVLSGDKRCLAELAASHAGEATVERIFAQGGQAACQ